MTTNEEFVIRHSKPFLDELNKKDADGMVLTRECNEHLETIKELK